VSAPYSPVSRAFLERTDLSAEARLIAVYLDTYTDNWTVREAQVTRALGLGRKPYQRAIRELKAAGLMRDGARTATGTRPPVFTGSPKVRTRRSETDPATQERDTKDRYVRGSETDLGLDLDVDSPPRAGSTYAPPALHSKAMGQKWCKECRVFVSWPKGTSFYEHLASHSRAS
jgi:hypothetical protein